MDWFSRRVLAWRLSNSLEAEVCVEALEHALDRYGKPEIRNTDQDSQLTGQAVTGGLQDHGIRISIGENGPWPRWGRASRANQGPVRTMSSSSARGLDPVGRGLKSEEVYLKAYAGRRCAGRDRCLDHVL